MSPLNGTQGVFCAGEMGFLKPKAFKKKLQQLQTEGESLGSLLPLLLYGIKFRMSSESRGLGKIIEE